MPTATRLLGFLISVTVLVTAFIFAQYMISSSSFVNFNLQRLSVRSLLVDWPSHLTALTRRSICNMASDTYSTVTYVTVPNHETGRNLSKLLISQRLAACVNIVKNVESIYEWKDKVEIDEEAMLIIKSNSDKTEDLTEFIEKHHPYDCPEVVTLRVDSGSKAYLNWIHETVNKQPIKPSSHDEEKK